jgi:TfoX/Sxy family transcriptional regulator of competence genes
VIFVEWKKAPKELVDFITEKMKGVKCDYRKMFGYPAYFINGNMFVGVFGDRLFLRLSDGDIARLAEAREDVSVFEPVKGRPMKGYVFLPKSVYSDSALFEEWLHKSIEYVSSLPPKQKQK